MYLTLKFLTATAKRNQAKVEKLKETIDLDTIQTKLKEANTND